MRLFVTAALLLAASPALAEHDGAVAAPRDPNLRAMRVALGMPSTEFGEWDYAVLAPALGSEFPAVSEDGRTIVQLFQDAQDFSGAPISTLVFWDRRGRRLASYRIGEGATDPAQAAKVRDDANARLRTTRWRPLATHTAATTETGRASTLALDGGATLSYAPDTGRLASTVRGRTRARRETFPAPGAASEPELPRGGCGATTSLAYGFGGADIGVAIVVGDANLGGDSCFGLPSADTALVLRLP